MNHGDHGKIPRNRLTFRSPCNVILESLRSVENVLVDSRRTHSVSGVAIQVNTILLTLQAIASSEHYETSLYYRTSATLISSDRTQNLVLTKNIKRTLACCRALADTSISASFRSLKQVSTTSGKVVLKLYDTIEASSARRLPARKQSERCPIICQKHHPRCFPISEACLA